MGYLSPCVPPALQQKPEGIFPAAAQPQHTERSIVVETTACRPLKLVIEVDGPYHLEGLQRVKDAERQAVLEKMGLFILRFLDEQVRLDMDVVLKAIKEYVIAFEAANPDCKPTLRGGKR